MSVLEMKEKRLVDVLIELYLLLLFFCHKLSEGERVHSMPLSLGSRMLSLYGLLRNHSCTK